METLTTFFYMGMAIVVGFFFGIIGFLIVILFGILHQSNMKRKKTEQQVVQRLANLDKLLSGNQKS